MESIEDEPRSGRPSISIIEEYTEKKIRNEIMRNHPLTVRELAENDGSGDATLTGIKMLVKRTYSEIIDFFSKKSCRYCRRDA